MSADLEKRITDLERQLKAIGQNYVQLKHTRTEGHKPGIDQINTNTMVYNEADGLWYSKKRLPDGTESIVLIGGGSPPGTSDPHLRAHQIDSIDDHPPVPEGKRGKWVHTNEVTGDIELEDLPQSDNYEYWRLKGSSVVEVKLGLLYNWFAATDARGFTSAGDFVVPSIADFTDLYDTIDTYDEGDQIWPIAGGILKSTESEFWESPNIGAINSVNFNMRGSGSRFHNDPDIPTASFFGGLKSDAYLWTNETPIDGLVITTDFYFNEEYITLSGYSFLSEGRSIRLVRPASESELLLADGTACTPYVGNDGKIYPTVKIGTQVWTAANSAETKYRNGDYIPGFDGGVYTPITNEAWAALTTSALCAYNDNLGNAFISSEIHVNSHDLVSFKNSGSVEFSVTETESGEKEITAITTGLIQDKNFRYTQNIPQAIWNITHAMNKYPAVTVTDTSGNEIKGSVQHIDQNALILTFAVPFAGFANLN